MKRRLCRQCHAEATYCEIEQRPLTILKRDGTVIRTIEFVTVYWCDLHTGITPHNPKAEP